MKRYISLDTETTGLDVKNDRIIEISCVEIINYRITGKYFHSYIKTDTKISKEAFKIHNIKGEFLRNKPNFKKISSKIKKIIGKSKLIIHNVGFDYKILKNEYKRIGMKIDFKTIDTLKIAKKKFPGKKNSLEFLCKRFNIKKNKIHSAYQDSINLAKIFIFFCMKQKKINLEEKNEKIDILSANKKKNTIIFK
ncbi:exonuclease domain-containing protein [Candidatus Vidania fulgoroideorum]